ncbi:type II toxin-antitoxin system PemK/MazF family toxin [Candidatus Gracilibacteria bacterium]|nr:type II toxin-antitoxin system PemK/MazF family toxin [Candidatus Gracilibacteria bacterium]
MFEFGTVVLVPFPFTNLESTTVRPALIISQKNMGDDVILAFITSQKERKGIVIEEKSAGFSKSGLKVASTVRLDKIATLNKKLILGELGFLPTPFLKTQKEKFLEVFGF